MNKIVHIDFKGAPVKLSYLRDLIPTLKNAGCTGFLLEYEDMFPYKDDLAILARKDSFKYDELKDFLDFCNKHDLVVIPLVQTYGHMEFVLKHEKFRSLRENFKHPMALCPSYSDSIKVVKYMIDQVAEAHSNSKYFHIGADEVTDVGFCQNCKSMDMDSSCLYLRYVRDVCNYVKKDKGLQAIMWDDMLRGIPESMFQGVQLSELVEVMIWDYNPLLAITDDYISKISNIFPRIWAASAFKGANGATAQLVNPSVYVKNNQSWIAKINQVNALKPNQFVGIVLTGWSRFDHFATLCELLPAAIPSLILCLSIVSQGVFTPEIHKMVSEQLGFPELIPWEPQFKLIDPLCKLNFIGSEVYQGISGWFLLNSEAKQLLNSDLVQGWMSKYHREKLLGNSLPVTNIVSTIDGLYGRFEKWKNVFVQFFNEILVEDGVNEWVECHIVLMMNKLKKYSKQGQQIIALGDSVFDRLKIEEKGDTV